MLKLRTLIFTAISPLIAVLLALEVHSQSIDSSIPTDEEITRILVDGEAWLYGSRELCDTYKTVFYEDGSYAALEYDDGFHDHNGVWYEPSWYLDGSPMGSYYSVQNGVLRLHSYKDRSRSETYGSYSTIDSASRYQIVFSDRVVFSEGDEEQIRPLPLVNCSVSDQEFANGIEEAYNQGPVSTSRFVVPSLENIQITRDVSDNVTHSMMEGYHLRREGRMDDIVFLDDDYDCNNVPRVTFGCSSYIQSLMDELILRRRRIGPEDSISIASNYENNCFNEEGRESSLDLRYATYRFSLSIKDNPPFHGVRFYYSYQRSRNESYFVSCTTPHDKARDVILSGNLFSLSNDELVVDLQEARQRARTLNDQYRGWNDSLPSCPCTRQLAEDSVWFKDATYPVITSTFHPNAAWEYRSSGTYIGYILPKESGNGLPTLRPGQQCTYSRDGKLITEGPGAGTPDAYSPEVTLPGQGLVVTASHTYWDVDPFKAEGMTWQEYHQTWTPDNGNNCSQNTGVSILWSSK